MGFSAQARCASPRCQSPSAAPHASLSNLSWLRSQCHSPACPWLAVWPTPTCSRPNLASPSTNSCLQKPPSPLPCSNHATASTLWSAQADTTKKTSCCATTACPHCKQKRKKDRQKLGLL